MVHNQISNKAMQGWYVFLCKKDGYWKTGTTPESPTYTGPVSFKYAQSIADAKNKGIAK